MYICLKLVEFEWEFLFFSMHNNNKKKFLKSFDI